MAIKPALNRLYTKRVLDVNADLAKRSKVFAFSPKQPTQCPNCIWDPANHCSTGKYNGSGSQPFDGTECPVCNNKGVIDESRKVRISANVRWPEQEARGNLRTTSGDIPVGHIKIKIPYTQWPIAEKAVYFLVDDKRYTRVGDADPVKRGLLNYVTTQFLAKLDA